MAAVSARARTKSERNDFSDLPELHAVSSGLKARCTELAADGLETCRRAIGGHGFTAYSGMVRLCSDYLSKLTVEGDDWMMPQQNARYILKMTGNVIKGTGSKKVESMMERMLRRSWSTKANEAVKLRLLGMAFEHVMARQAFEIYQAQHVDKKPESDLQIKRNELSTIQSSAQIVRSFTNGLSSPSVPASVKPILPLLLHLFAYTTIQQQHMFEFQSASFIDRDGLSQLPDEILTLMKSVKPHAVKLVDAFMIPDYLLDSSLGRSDGKVYEDMFYRAHKLNPLNEITFNSDHSSDELEVGGDKGERVLSKL